MRPLPRLLAPALVAMFAAFSLFAAEGDTATGMLTINGRRVELKYAIAVRTPSAFDSRGTQTKLLISSIPVPVATFADAFKMMKLKNLSAIEVSIEDDGQIVSGTIYDPSLTTMGGSFSIIGPHQFERARESAAGTFAGKLYMKEADEYFGYRFIYTATFAAPLIDPQSAVAPAAAKAGKVLPADGGDPGAAYRTYVAAMDAGDLKKLKELVSRKRAKQMDSPDFPEMFAMVREMMPRGIKVTGGSIDGRKALLTLAAGEQGDGTTKSGTCVMLLENGAWRVEKESWKTTEP